MRKRYVNLRRTVNFVTALKVYVRYNVSVSDATIVELNNDVGVINHLILAALFDLAIFNS